MKSSTSGLKLAASLALITVLGPSAIDMYLPSMPDMAHELNASYSRVQLTLTVFLLAMGAGQLLFGPIVDAYGRRKPLLLAIVVFAGAAAWAANTTTIEALLYARFIQGMAAALTLVVAMSTVRDVCEGAEAAKLFALLMTIEGLAPVMAPAIGGYVDAHFGWRAVMWVLAAMAVMAFVNTAINLPESLPKSKRLSLNPLKVLQTYARIGYDGNFLLPALALSAAFFFLFAYIGGAALVYQSQFGLAPDTFGLVFGGTGIAVLIGAMASARLVSRYGVAGLAVRGVLAMAIGAAIAATAACLDAGLPVIVFGMFIAMFGLGIAEATLMSMAMASQQRALGSTAALLGAFQLVISSAATPLAGQLAEKSARHWLLFLTGLGVFVLILAVASAKRAPQGLSDLAGH